MISNNPKILKLIKITASYLFYRWHNYRFNKIVETLQSNEMQILKKKYEKLNAKYCKYFNHYNTSLNGLRRSIMLELHVSRKKEILDLGCGFGVFGLHSKSFGHSYTGLDMWDEADLNCHLFREVFSVLHPEKKRIDHKIERFKRLDCIDKKYDIITAFQICFTLFNSNEAWDVEEWKYFLHDLNRCLKDEGRILLYFSKPDNSKLFRSPSVETFFNEIGAEINGPYVNIGPTRMSPFWLGQ